MNQSWGPAIEALLHQLGLTTGDIARFALFALVLIVLVPVYFIAKILGGTTGRGRIDISFGRGSSDSFASDSDDSITAGSPEKKPDPLDRTRAVLVATYKVLMYGTALVLLVAALWLWRFASAANGLNLVVILLIAFALIVWLQTREKVHEMDPESDPFPSIKVTQTVQTAAPTVFKMGNDVIQKAKDLRQAGSDMDAVCRQINPEYSRWGSVERAAFREMIDAVLKSEQSS